MTEDIRTSQSSGEDPTIQLGRQRVPGVWFMRDQSPPSGVGYQAQDTGRTDIVHVSTDDVSQQAHIRDLLIAQIRTASCKVLFCSFLFADEDIVQALCEAAERLHGGVYILTALGKHLHSEVLELDGEVDAQTSKQRERAQRHEEHLRRLARSGAWLRSVSNRSSSGPMPGRPQMPSSLAVLPIASAALMPSCCSKVQLTVNSMPSLRRAMTSTSGQLWNTSSNFSSERRWACSTRLASLMSIIRPRSTVPSSALIRVTMSRIQTTLPSAASIR